MFYFINYFTFAALIQLKSMQAVSINKMLFGVSTEAKVRHTGLQILFSLLVVLCRDTNPCKSTPVHARYYTHDSHPIFSYKI